MRSISTSCQIYCGVVVVGTSFSIALLGFHDNCSSLWYVTALVITLTGQVNYTGLTQFSKVNDLRCSDLSFLKYSSHTFLFEIKFQA